MREQLLKNIEELNLQHYREEIISTVRPALKIRSKRNDQLPVGRSKFGGQPDLPPDIIYPTYGDNQPLTFLAQYRLEDFAAFNVDSLPQKGMLYFFHPEVLEDEEEDWWEPANETGWVEGPGRWVLYWNGDPSLLQPFDVNGRVHRYQQAEIWFEETFTGFSHYEKVNRSQLPKQDAYSLGLLGDRYEEGFDHQLLGYPIPQQGWAQLLGYPQQPGERIDQQIVDNLILLLQLNSDTELNMQWGDFGTLYFLIAPEDLKEHHFERVIYEWSE